jgi:hypothetical protein
LRFPVNVVRSLVIERLALAPHLVKLHDDLARRVHFDVRINGIRRALASPADSDAFRVVRASVDIDLELPPVKSSTAVTTPLQCCVSSRRRLCMMCVWLALV